ncbi:hypothetical protein JMG10_47400, partial [Nostoc ellipsosporum NOK]|nr:hypothetical protein [Nostoc ellipsosporum NOK]
MLATEDVESDFELLIIGALAYGGRAWNRLFEPARRYALKIVHARASELAPDLRQEVVQQALMNLMRTGPDRLNPAKGRASTLFAWCVREAIQQVRASMAKPGNVTRSRGKPEQRAATVLSWDEVAETMPKAASTTHAEEVETRLDTAKILFMAPPPVARALQHIHLDEGTLASAAKLAALSRFQL